MKIQKVEFQTTILDEIGANYDEGLTRQCVISPCGSGKCCAWGTPIIKYDGTIVPVQDVVVGDLLMGPDSQPRLVTSLARGKEEMWTITPIKGDPFTVNESHILSFKVSKELGQGRTEYAGQMVRADDIVNLEVRDYLKLSKWKRTLLKCWRPAGIDFPNAGTLHPEMPPYILGLWLGDGSQTPNNCTQISKPDPEVLASVTEYAESVGCIVTTAREQNKCPVHRVRTVAGKRSSNNPMREALLSLDLPQNRHIPHAYKCGSRETRMQVLAGYLDADGYLANPCNYDAITKVERLADDICFVARSLGFAAYKSKQWKKATNTDHAGDWYWRLSISGAGLDQLPVRLPKRKSPPSNQAKNHLYTGIKSIEPQGVGDYYGFTLSGNDRLFLLGDFTVTHNTVLITRLITEEALPNGLRTLIVVNKEALLGQTLEKLKADGLDIEKDCWVVAGGFKDHNPAAKVWIASQQALARRPFWRDLPPKHAIDIVCLDEAHESAFSKVGTYICEHKDKFPLVLGFTATPYRLARNQGMTQRFQVAVKGPVPSKLIDMGWLAPIRTFVMTDPNGRIDLSKVGTRAGEFIDADLAVACDKQALIEHAIDSWQSISGGDKRTLVFGVNIKHATNLNAAFLARGVRSVLVTGETPKAERHEIYDKFKAGEILVLCSVDVVSVGFDAVEAEVAVICRPTKSKAKAWQITGRVGRRSPHTNKKEGIVIDQAGNALRLSTAELLSEYEMDAPAESSGKGGSGNPTKACPQCGVVVPNFTRECECGHVFGDQRIEEGGEMVELTLKSRIDRLESKKRSTLTKFCKEAYSRQLSPGYASVKFKEAFGGWPNDADRTHAVFAKPTLDNARDYLRYLAGIAAKKEHDKSWVAREFEREFGTSYLMSDVIATDRLLAALPIFKAAKGSLLAALRGG